MAQEARALCIRTGAACLEIERWTWRVDAPVTRVRQLFPGDRYDLVAEFNPGTGG
jgi:GntR family histidine utilization transcriptional repressor